MSATPRFPPRPGAWLLTVPGVLLVPLTLNLHWTMYLVVFAGKPVSAGGAEYMQALFLGVPAIAAGLLLLGIATARRSWRSQLGVVALSATALIALMWVPVVIADGLRHRR